MDKSVSLASDFFSKLGNEDKKHLLNFMSSKKEVGKEVDSYGLGQNILQVYFAYCKPTGKLKWNLKLIKHIIGLKGFNIQHKDRQGVDVLM